jgi:hypothetical protein
LRIVVDRERRVVWDIEDSKTLDASVVASVQEMAPVHDKGGYFDFRVQVCRLLSDEFLVDDIEEPGPGALLQLRARGDPSVKVHKILACAEADTCAIHNFQVIEP